MRSWVDFTGGLDNLISFRKNAFGIRQWQQTFGTATAYSSYMDVVLANNTGDSTVTGSFRAPIFYDSNNTGYYTDPNGVSRIGSISLDTIPVTAGINSLTTAPVQLTGTYNIGTTNTWMPLTHQRAVYNSGFTTHLNTGLYKQASTWGPGESGWYAAIGGNDTYPTEAWYLTFGGFIKHTQGFVTTSGSSRAPVFYDSDNTAYYLDPDGATSLNGTLAINNGATMSYGWNRNMMLAARFPVLVFNSADAKYSGIGVDYTFASAGMYFWVNGSSADVTGTGTIALGINTGNFVTAFGSFRAPIYYDSNDTLYYCNPNDTSALNIVNCYYLRRNSHHTGHLEGGYNNIGNSQNFTNPIFTIGSSYNPAASTLGNMYGIGYNNASIGFHPSGAAGWGLYLASAGVSRIWLDSDNGHIIAVGNITAYASDRRLKTNIKPISNPIDKVMRIRGVEFDWVNNIEEIGFKPLNMHETGVIAQEIQAVIPDAVMLAPFNNNATTISGVDNEYLTVDKEKIIPLLIEAIKEQQTMINILNDKITLMESK